MTTTTTTDDFPCFENEAQTNLGCIPLDDLEGTTYEGEPVIILGTWDCHEDGNQICGQEVQSTSVAPSDPTLSWPVAVPVLIMLVLWARLVARHT